MNKISSQDRAALIRLASSLPAGNPTRKAILAGLARKTARSSAIEPYQKVEGVPYGRGGKKDLLRVKTEKQLRALSVLLDRIFESGRGRDSIVLSPQQSRALLGYGVTPATLIKAAGNYDLWVTDATGTEYDVANDLGISASN